MQEYNVYSSNTIYRRTLKLIMQSNKPVIYVTTVIFLVSFLIRILFRWDDTTSA